MNSNARLIACESFIATNYLGEPFAIDMEFFHIVSGGAFVNVYVDLTLEFVLDYPFLKYAPYQTFFHEWSIHWVASVYNACTVKRCVNEK